MERIKNKILGTVQTITKEFFKEESISQSVESAEMLVKSTKRSNFLKRMLGKKNILIQNKNNSQLGAAIVAECESDSILRGLITKKPKYAKLKQSKFGKLLKIAEILKKKIEALINSAISFALLNPRLVLAGIGILSIIFFYKKIFSLLLNLIDKFISVYKQMMQLAQLRKGEPTNYENDPSYIAKTQLLQELQDNALALHPPGDFNGKIRDKGFYIEDESTNLGYFRYINPFEEHMNIANLWAEQIRSEAPTAIMHKSPLLRLLEYGSSETIRFIIKRWRNSIAFDTLMYLFPSNLFTQVVMDNLATCGAMVKVFYASPRNKYFLKELNLYRREVRRLLTQGNPISTEIRYEILEILANLSQEVGFLIDDYLPVDN